MKKYAIYVLSLMALAISGCSKNKDVEPDTEYPTIDAAAASAFPKQCSELQRGQTFTFRALFRDNVELGSSSIDIHHNFDHHSHSTEVNECGLDSKKTPVNPLTLVKVFAIPAGSKTYEMNQQIVVPADIDPGDYHFMIRLTDKEGWQTIKGLSIKIK